MINAAHIPVEAVGCICVWSCVWLILWYLVNRKRRTDPPASTRVAHSQGGDVPHDERTGRQAWRHDIDSLRDDIEAMPHGQHRRAMVRALEQLEATYGYAD